MLIPTLAVSHPSLRCEAPNHPFTPFQEIFSPRTPLSFLSLTETRLIATPLVSPSLRATVSVEVVEVGPASTNRTIADNWSGFLSSRPFLFNNIPLKPPDNLSGFWRKKLFGEQSMSAEESTLPYAVRFARPFELGEWLGRHQALAWMTSRCSAADAHALREIRDLKHYRTVDLTWEEFCPIHVGFSHKKADRIIGQLEEFGDSYFNLTEILNIPAPEFRALQPAIEDNTLEFDGRRIPITRENTQELIEAVRTLRTRLQREARSPLCRLQSRLDRVAGEIAGAIRRSEGSNSSREQLLAIVQEHARIIEALQCSLQD
jgi:hypothetical protein